MLYVQFWQSSALDKSKLIEACGDRAVVILDARVNQRTNMAISEAECRKRRFLAYQWHKGETFTRSHPVGPVIVLENQS